MKKAEIIFAICLVALLVVSIGYANYKAREKEEANINHVAELIKKNILAKDVKGQVVGKDSVEFSIVTNELSPMEIGADSMKSIIAIGKKYTDKYFNNFTKIGYKCFSFDSLAYAYEGVCKDQGGDEPCAWQVNPASITDSVAHYCDSLTLALKASRPVYMRSRRKWYNREHTSICAILTMNVVLPYSLGDSTESVAERIVQDFCKSNLKDAHYYKLMEVEFFETTSIEAAEVNKLPRGSNIIDVSMPRFFKSK